MAAESPVHLATGRQNLHPAQQLTASTGAYHIDRPIKHNNKSIVKLMSSAGTLRPEPKAQGEPAKLPRNLVVGSPCGPLGTGTEVGPLCAHLRIQVKVPPGGETSRTRLRETARPAAAANHKVSREFRRESQGPDDQF